ncbi:MAG: hypothetical protein PHT92_06040 [Bacteroidales bacterium]|nr:hypothetical protein [Bacteroidales bacterium]
MIDTKKTLQEANGYLRNAERSMFSGKNEKAVELLNKADEICAVAKQHTPDDFQVKSLMQKIEKLRKDLERKGVSTRPGGNNQLPFEAQAQLNRIRDHVVRKELEWAKRELDTYYSRFAGPLTDIPEIKELAEHIKLLEQEERANAQQKAEANREMEVRAQQNEELCKLWVDRFKGIPYFDGTPQNIPGLLQHKESFGKAQDLLAEYSQVAFTSQVTITLESIVTDTKMRVQQFPSRFAETTKLLIDEVGKQINDRIEFLNRDVDWISDKNQKPYLIGKKEIDGFTQQIDELRPLFTDSSSSLESVLNALSKLMELNESRQLERSKLTTMKPEAIVDSEAAEPKAAALMALSTSTPNAKVLRVAVVKPWESKRVEEWADSTKTQWIVKNISETTVQVAAELPDGSCKLYTMHVEKEVAPNGSFGIPRSHIMFEELMAKENI